MYKNLCRITDCPDYGYICFVHHGDMRILALFSVEPHASAVSPAWLLLNAHGLFSAMFVVSSFTVNAFITANLSLFLMHSVSIFQCIDRHAVMVRCPLTVFG